MPRRKSATPTTAKKKMADYSIFDTPKITSLALEWQRLVKDKRHDEAMRLLNEIIILSTPMFIRLAQHEKYDHLVDIDRLVVAAQSKVIRWLIGWKPKDDKTIFTWFSACAKNAFRSEVTKESQFRARMHVTGDNLEKFFGEVDHPSYSEEKSSFFEQSLDDLTSRWGSEQEIGAIRFIALCLFSGLHERQKIIRSAAYAYGITPELSKFFYNWVLIQMRRFHYKKIRVPVSEQDLYRHAHTYSHLVDLLDIVTWDQMKQIIAIMGGTRLKIPTLSQLAKLKDNFALYEEIEETDLDPTSVSRVGKRHGKSAKTAEEAYHDMMTMLDGRRNTAIPVFEDDYLA